MNDFEKDRIEFENQKYRDKAHSSQDQESMLKFKSYTRKYSGEVIKPNFEDKIPNIGKPYHAKKKPEIY